MSAIVLFRGESLPYFDNLPSPASAYGVGRQYDLRVIDNQKPYSGYGNGLPKEDFPGNQMLPNGQKGGSTFGLDLDSGTGSPSNQIPDYIIYYKRTPPASYSDKITTLSQDWYCMELTPPYNAPDANLYIKPYTYGPNGNGLNPPVTAFLDNVYVSELNTHTIEVHYDNIQRSGDN